MKTGQYADVVVRRRQEIEAIQFSEEETAEIIKKAILVAKITRWNEQQNREYFERLEKHKGNL